MGSTVGMIMSDNEKVVVEADAVAVLVSEVDVILNGNLDEI
jgi:hypothetical protein